jgi:hypothetical protein
MYEYISGFFLVKYSCSFKIYVDSSVVFKSSLSLNHWRNIVRNVTRIVVWTQKEWNAFWSGQYITISDNSRRPLVNECINMKIIKTRKDYRENWKFSYPKRTLLSLVIRHLITYYLIKKFLHFRSMQVYNTFNFY